MGRGRVQLKRIENKINRQVTFSKRKSGLSKKAHEISVLCDVNVALIVFSTRGKLYEYSTNSSMEKILERYEHYTYAERAFTEVEPESQGNLCHEYVKLKAKVEVLQKSHRHLIGEELGSLSMKELQQLEQQLQSALKHIRSKKNHLLFDSISELQHKERSLKEQNNILEKLLEEKARLLTQDGHLDVQGQPPTSSSSPSFSMPDTLPTLNIGTYQQRDSPNEAPICRATLPPWMLPHVNGVGQRSVNFGGNPFLASNSPT